MRKSLQFKLLIQAVRLRCIKGDVQIVQIVQMKITHSNFLIPKSLQPELGDRGYF